ncbi:MAG: hypothetical protein VX252_10215 [Myxococcota bacterium]|nr:hypothetical protein [Myxococcota bacterium]
MRNEGLARWRLFLSRRPGLALLVSIGFLVPSLLGGCGILSSIGPAPKPGPALQPSAAPIWSLQNGPIIKAYLSSLPQSSVGTKLPGIRLSDGNLWLKDYTYLGPGRNLPPGLSARFVEDESTLYAYLWMEEGAEALPLSPCEDGPQRGIRARQAGGGAFAWKHLSAKEGVVYTECPPADWLPPGVKLGPPAEAT